MLLSFSSFGWAFFPVGHSFQLSRSPMYLQLSWQNSSGEFLQKPVLIGFSINYRNAVMRKVLMFPAHCSKHTSMSLISMFSKFSGVKLVCFKQVQAWASVLQQKNFANALLTLRYELLLHNSGQTAARELHAACSNRNISWFGQPIHHRGFFWLAPSKKVSTPQIEIWNDRNQWSFYQLVVS